MLGSHIGMRLYCRNCFIYAVISIAKSAGKNLLFTEYGASTNKKAGRIVAGAAGIESDL